MSSTEQNRQAWNRLVEKRDRLTAPAKDEEFRDPLRSLDSAGWLGESVRGWRVLCLASGGGRQGPLFAAAGAKVTVVDLSDAMLAQDRQVAAERGLDLATVQTSMEDLSALAPESFDLVWQAVSSCYVPDVGVVYRQVARVLRVDGLYLSQHKQPANLQAEIKPTGGGYELLEPYYRTGPLPAVEGSPHREPGTLEYLHRWEELIGGLCRSGFVVEDLLEPCHAKADASRGSFPHRSQFIAPYVRIKARKIAASGTHDASSQASASGLWIPGSSANES